MDCESMLRPNKGKFRHCVCRDHLPAKRTFGHLDSQNYFFLLHEINIIGHLISLERNVY